MIAAAPPFAIRLKMEQGKDDERKEAGTFKMPPMTTPETCTS
jgi:hypothetical protein